MKLRHEGTYARVTAAAQGIDGDSALAFAEAGTTVVATDTSAEKLDLTDGISTLLFNVLDSSAIASFIDRESHFDVFFNCAGFIHGGSVLECTDDDWIMPFDLNVKSMFPMSQVKIAHMAVYLAGDESIFTLGTLIKVERGMSI